MLKRANRDMRTETRGRIRGFTARVPGADHDDVK